MRYKIESTMNVADAIIRHVAECQLDEEQLSELYEELLDDEPREHSKLAGLQKDDFARFCMARRAALLTSYDSTMSSTESTREEAIAVMIDSGMVPEPEARKIRETWRDVWECDGITIDEGVHSKEDAELIFTYAAALDEYRRLTKG